MSRARPSRVRRVVGRYVNRGTVARRIARYGHPRLRAFEGRMRRDELARRAFAPGLAWLQGGNLHIPGGYAHGMRMSLAHLPLGLAHFGAIAEGLLETPVQEAMLRHLGPGGVFYDVGANVGFFTLLGARLAGPSGHVYAFEPAPDNAEAVRVNADLNELDNVTVLEVAVGAAAGRGRLQIVDDQSWSKLEDYGPHPTAERVVDVELVTIDDLVAAGEILPPTAVKLDVEGAEIAALEGMRSTLADHRPAVICELHDTNREFLELAGSFGYRIINLEGTGPVVDAAGPAHVLALPPNHPGD